MPFNGLPPGPTNFNKVKSIFRDCNGETLSHGKVISKGDYIIDEITSVSARAMTNKGVSQHSENQPDFLNNIGIGFELINNDIHMFDNYTKTQNFSTSMRDLCTNDNVKTIFSLTDEWLGYFEVTINYRWYDDSNEEYNSVSEIYINIIGRARNGVDKPWNVNGEIGEIDIDLGTRFSNVRNYDYYAYTDDTDEDKNYTKGTSPVYSLDYMRTILSPIGYNNDYYSSGGGFYVPYANCNLTKHNTNNWLICKQLTSTHNTPTLQGFNYVIDLDSDDTQDTPRVHANNGNRGVATRVTFIAEEYDVSIPKVVWVPDGATTAKFPLHVDGYDGLGSYESAKFLTNDYGYESHSIRVISDELNGIDYTITADNGVLMLEVTNLPNTLKANVYSFEIFFVLSTDITKSKCSKVFSIAKSNGAYGFGVPESFTKHAYKSYLLGRYNVDLPLIGGATHMNVTSDNEYLPVLQPINNIECVSIGMPTNPSTPADGNGGFLTTTLNTNKISTSFSTQIKTTATTTVMFGGYALPDTVDGKIVIIVQAGIPFYVKIDDYDLYYSTPYRSRPSRFEYNDISGFVKVVGDNVTYFIVGGILYNPNTDNEFSFFVNSRKVIVKLIVKPMALIDVIDAVHTTDSLTLEHYTRTEDETYDGLNAIGIDGNNENGIQVPIKLPNNTTGTHDLINFSETRVVVKASKRVGGYNHPCGSVNYVDPNDISLKPLKMSFNGEVDVITGIALKNYQHPENTALTDELDIKGKGGAIYIESLIKRDNYPTFATDKQSIIIIRTKGDPTTASDTIVLTGSHLDNVTLPANAENYDNLKNITITRGDTENTIIFSAVEENLDIGNYTTIFKVNNEFEIPFKLSITNNVIPTKYSPEQYDFTAKYKTAFFGFITMEDYSPDVTEYSIDTGTLPNGLNLTLAIDPETNVNSVKVYGELTEHNVDSVITLLIKGDGVSYNKTVKMRIVGAEPTVEDKVLTIEETIPKPVTPTLTDSLLVTPNNTGNFIIDYIKPDGETVAPFNVSGENTDSITITSNATPNTLIANRTGKIYADTSDGVAEVDFQYIVRRTVTLEDIVTDVPNADIVVIADGTSEVNIENHTAQVAKLYIYNKDQADESRSSEVTNITVIDGTLPSGITLSTAPDINGLQSIKISGAFTSQPNDNVEITYLKLGLQNNESITTEVMLAIKHNRNIVDPTNGAGYSYYITNGGEVLLENNLTSDSGDIDSFEILSGTLPNGLNAVIQNSTSTNKDVVVYKGTTNNITVTDNYNQYDILLRSKVGSSYVDFPTKIRVYDPIVFESYTFNKFVHPNTDYLLSIPKTGYINNTIVSSDTDLDTSYFQSILNYSDEMKIRLTNVPLGEHVGIMTVKNNAEQKTIDYSITSVVKPILVTSDISLHLPTSKQYQGYVIECSQGDIVRYEITSGTLPSGLSLSVVDINGNKRVKLTGTPTENYNGTVFLKVFSLADYYQYVKFAIVIEPMASFDNSVYKYYEEPNISFLKTITPSNVLVSNITASNLPNGLHITTLDGSIKISGLLPDGVYETDITVEDTNGFTQDIKVIVNTSKPITFLSETTDIVITPDTDIDLRIDTGGIASEITIDNGTLPDGLSFEFDNGLKVVGRATTLAINEVVTTVSNTLNNVSHTFRFIVNNTNIYTDNQLQPYVYNGVTNNITLPNSNYPVQTVTILNGTLPNGITITKSDTNEIKISGTPDVVPSNEVIIVTVKSNDVEVNHVFLLKFRDLDINFDATKKSFSSVLDEGDKIVIFNNNGGKINNVTIDKPLPNGVSLSYEDGKVSISGKATELFDKKEFKIEVEGRNNPS